MGSEKRGIDTRGKLTEILQRDDCPLLYILGDNVEALTNYLIAHGVTLQNITDSDFGRWVPVEEKLPDLIPCNAGTGYSEAVNVLTEGRKVLTAIWDGTDFIADADFWDAEGEEITHWTPVLLPLPEDTNASKFNHDGDCCNKEGEH